MMTKIAPCRPKDRYRDRAVNDASSGDFFFIHTSPILMEALRNIPRTSRPMDKASYRDVSMLSYMMKLSTDKLNKRQNVFGPTARQLDPLTA